MYLLCYQGDELKAKSIEEIKDFFSSHEIAVHFTINEDDLNDGLCNYSLCENWSIEKVSSDDPELDFLDPLNRFAWIDNDLVQVCPVFYPPPKSENQMELFN